MMINVSLPDSRVIDVHDFSVAFRTRSRTVDAVRNISFAVDRGETLAIDRESGSGKSVTSLALMRLVEHGGGAIMSGSIAFRRRNGHVLDLAKASSATMRGADIAMIFQEPMTSLNPVFTVGDQIAEAIALHQNKGHAEARNEALRLLDLVRIPESKRVFGRYPHQLSGGMRQRVMIAMALSCKPALLIADEPTTALDVTIQAQILQLIRGLQDEMNMGVIFITHDMGVVAEVADRVLVMYRGEKVEEAKSDDLFWMPKYSYTKALLAAVPTLGAMRGTDRSANFPILEVEPAEIAPDDASAVRSSQAVEQETQPAVDETSTPILRVRDLVTRFPVKSGLFGRTAAVHAVERVSFDLRQGETLALVGESGCGKSTTGRSLLRLVI